MNILAGVGAGSANEPGFEEPAALVFQHGYVGHSGSPGNPPLLNVLRVVVQPPTGLKSIAFFPFPHACSQVYRDR